MKSVMASSIAFLGSRRARRPARQRPLLFESTVRCHRALSGARVLLLAAAVALLSAVPAGAHVLNEGGPTGWNFALASVGVVAVGTGIALSAKRRRRAGLGLFVVGIVSMTVAGSGPIFPPGPRSSPVRISIVEPQWGATVTSPVTVRIELTDGVLVPMDRTSGPPTEGHLHLYANGRAVGMFDKAEETIELPPGKYVLQVEFTGADHRSFEPFVADTVEFEVVAGEN